MSKTCAQIPVTSSLLKQNCYIREVVPSSEKSFSSQSASFYSSLETSVEADGIKEKIVDYPYPITPDYVKSFADSTDYKIDPLSAIASSDNSRKSLGDIRDLQEISSMDATQAASLYAQLRARFEAAASSNESPVSQKKDGGDK